MAATLKLSTAKHPSASVDNITLDSAGGVAFGGDVSMASGSPFRKNIIIGGNFTTNPWQRGTSFTNLANGVYGPDRFLVERSDDAAVNVAKTADAPTAAQAGVYSAHCLHGDVTTADATIGASQSYRFSHRVEGLNLAHMGFGQSGTRYLTMSFWHKHTKTGTYCFGMYNSAADRSYVAEYTQDVSDTWEKATITFPVDTSGTWLYDNGIGIYLNWTMAAGSNFHGTANAWQAGLYFATSNQVNALDNTANNFKIALVQLEPGSVATAFEYRTVQDEVELCQRYYEKSYPLSVVPGTASQPGSTWWHVSSTANGYIYGTIFFKVQKRATPTMAFYSYAGTSGQASDGTVTDVGTCSISGQSSEYQASCGNATGGTVTPAGSNITVHWTASAEL